MSSSLGEETAWNDTCENIILQTCITFFFFQIFDGTHCGNLFQSLEKGFRENNGGISFLFYETLAHFYCVLATKAIATIGLFETLVCARQAKAHSERPHGGGTVPSTPARSRLHRARLRTPLPHYDVQCEWNQGFCAFWQLWTCSVRPRISAGPLKRGQSKLRWAVNVRNSPDLQDSLEKEEYKVSHGYFKKNIDCMLKW